MELICCSNCDTLVEYEVVAKEETYPVRGVETTILADVATCHRCKRSLFHEQLDEKNLQRAYTQYRRKRGVLTPDQIREIRQKYGLSQRALGRFLRLGEVTINRYENGALPSDAHNELLILVGNPNNALKLLDATGSDLSMKEEEALRETIAGLAFEGSRCCLRDLVEQSIGVDVPLEYSGFRHFDAARIKEMIVYCARNAQPLSKIKLMKLLFYMDFTQFKRSGVSISGVCYVALPFGPAIDRWQLLLAWLEEERAITVESNDEGHDYLFTESDFDATVFAERELQVVGDIVSRLGSVTAKSLVNKSHAEDAFTKTESGQLISYEHALTLTVS